MWKSRDGLQGHLFQYEMDQPGTKPQNHINLSTTNEWNWNYECEFVLYFLITQFFQSFTITSLWFRASPILLFLGLSQQFRLEFKFLSIHFQDNYVFNAKWHS